MSLELLAMVALRTTILLAFALGVCLLAGRRPALRRAVGRAALVGTLLLAAFTVWNPRLVRPTVEIPPLPAPESPAPVAAAPPEKPRTYRFTPPFHEPIPVPAEPEPESEPVTATKSGGGGFLLVWAGGAGLLSLHLLLGYAALFRLRRRCRPVEAAALGRVCADFGIATPRLVAGEAVTNPFVAGAIRPTIYLPVRLLEGEDLEPILRHEAAHLAGNDLRWSLLHRMALILLWPQPLLWLLKRPVEAASETLCDGQVLAGGVSAHSYAACLLNLRETAAPRVPVGIGAVSGRSSFARRIEAILTGRIAVRLSAPLRVAVLAATLALAGGASLLAFGQAEPKPTVPPAPFAESLKVGSSHLGVAPAALVTPVTGESEWRYEVTIRPPGVFDWKRSTAEVRRGETWSAASLDAEPELGLLQGGANGDGPVEQGAVRSPALSDEVPPDALRLTLLPSEGKGSPVIVVFDRSLAPLSRPKGRRVRVRILSPDGAPVKQAWATFHADPFLMSHENLRSFSWAGEDIPVQNGVAEVVLPEVPGAESSMLLVRSPDYGMGMVRFNGRKPEMELRMSRPIEVVGRILNSDGTPAVGVRIVAKDIRLRSERTIAEGLDHGPDIPGRFSSPTDKDGNYRIGNLPQGAQVSFGRLDERYGALGLPTLNLPTASRIVLPTVRLERAARIEGRVLWRGAGVEGAIVMLGTRKGTGSGYYSGLSGPDGRYSFPGLASGTYQLGVMPRMPRREPWVARGFPQVTVTEGQVRNGMDFHAQSGGLIVGRVLDARGRPLPGATVLLNGGRVVEKDQVSVLSGVTDKTGTYRIRMLPGRYPIEVYRAGLPKGTRPIAPSTVVVQEGKTVRKDFQP